MDDLIAFLRERLDDAEDDYRTGPWPRWDIKPSEMAARIKHGLDDVAAKRRVIRLLQQYEAAIEQESATAKLADPIPTNLYAARDALNEVVRLLSQPFASHPDFREEWRL